MTGRSDRHPFEYALVRVVPRVERGESINAGLLLYCRALDYLGSRVQLDHVRLLALDPGADVAGIEAALAGLTRVCVGAQGSGPVAAEDIGARFRWLTAPRSTVVQPGPIHTGLTHDPDAEADRLLALLVAPVQP
jgi:Protein of unknown function (DUF3037)